MIILERNGLRLTLCSAGEYYQGTRFDHAGVFRRIEKDSYVYADEWFDSPDPFRHDNVCGPSEEFMTVDWSDVHPGDTFFKPGVGMLRRPDSDPYDRFRLYEIVDKGEWKEEADAQKVVYCHTLKGIYEYRKTIQILTSNRFTIRHHIIWKGKKRIEGYVYNHNFFTFGGKKVGPGRSIEFKFRPEGTWREHYDNIRICKNSLEFLDGVSPQKSVFMGDLHNSEGDTFYDFKVKDESRLVKITSQTNAKFCVFWSSPKVACIEPYTPIRLNTSDSFLFDIEYMLK